MSKEIKKFFAVFRGGKDVMKKLLGEHALGARIFPSRNSKNDTKYQLRLDAGPLVDGRYRQLNLQVNSQATSGSLKDWLKKYGSHANLATGELDTTAENLEEEIDRAFEDMMEQAKKNI